MDAAHDPTALPQEKIVTFAGSQVVTFVGSEDESEESSSESLSEALLGQASGASVRLSTSDTCFVESVERFNYALAVQIRALSQEAFGKGEDAMQIRRGEKVAALLLGGEVCGYASYIVRRDLQSFSLHKLAVSEAHRRRGVGRILLR